MIVLRREQQILMWPVNNIAERTAILLQVKRKTTITLAFRKGSNVLCKRVIKAESRIEFQFPTWTKLELRPSSQCIQPSDLDTGVDYWTSENHRTADPTSQCAQGFTPVKFAANGESRA